MEVLIRYLLTRLVEKTSAQQCFVVKMAESQEHREIGDNAVSINADTSTPTRVVRAANPSRITYQSERYNQVKILN